MLVPDLILEVVLFGALLLAALLDSFVPGLHGAATFVAVGAALYVVAQEFSSRLEKRGWWTQESLATSLALCTAGFIYYWWLNQSDFALLALSIGLMMASLMLTIAILGSIGSAIRDASATPIVGFLVTFFAAIALGVLGGLLILALGRPTEQSPLWMKAVLIAVSALVWKLRQNARPPRSNLTAAVPTVVVGTAADGSEVMVEKPSQPVVAPTQPVLIPQNGTLLDRFLPALVLGALLFLLSQPNTNWLMAPFSPTAIADSPNNAQQGSPPPPPTP
jgi:hypothetical protein